MRIDPEDLYIQPLPTPNPSTVKFRVNYQFMGFGGRDFPTAETAAGSPLAEKLWKIGDVGGVFVGTDFVTITERSEDCDWVALSEAVMETMREHIVAGEPHVKVVERTASSPADSAIEARIREILDQEIRPAVAMDGGDITYEGFEDGVVLLHMVGSCSGCPSSTATLRQGIEARLRDEIPEVNGVMAV